MRIKYSKLINQTRLIEILDKNSPSVEIGIYFKIGSRYDLQEYSGISHLIEHLNFQGTENRPDNKSLVLEIENLGGNIDAFTSYEYMGFVIHAPSDKQTQIWEILFDMVFRSEYKKEEIEKEKKVIIEEIKMYDDIPSEKVREEFQQMLFKGNTLANNIGGSESSLERIDQEIIRDFVKKGLVAKNILITLAGCYSTELLIKINDLLSEITNDESEIQYDRFVQTKPLENIYIERDVAQTNLIIGSYGLARNMDNRYALKIGQAMLSGGMGSILFQKIREELRLVYSIHASHNSFSDIGTFSIEMGLDEKNVKNAYQNVIKILEQLKNGKYGKEVFERAKNYYKGLVITNIQSCIDVASWNAVNLLLNENMLPEEPHDVIAKIDQIEYNNIIDIWSQFLDTEKIFLVQLAKNKVII